MIWYTVLLLKVSTEQELIQWPLQFYVFIVLQQFYVPNLLDICFCRSQVAVSLHDRQGATLELQSAYLPLVHIVCWSLLTLNMSHLHIELPFGLVAFTDHKDFLSFCDVCIITVQSIARKLQNLICACAKLLTILEQYNLLERKLQDYA